MQFGKTCTRKFWKDAQIALVLWTRAILNVFQKLTRACFSQIALETILLPMLMTNTLTNIDVVIFLSASFFGRSYQGRQSWGGWGGHVPHTFWSEGDEYLFIPPPPHFSTYSMKFSSGPIYYI